jgi:putative NADH-flavin reductase
MANIVIFGGTGYAGSAIATEAVKRGHTVIAVSRSGTAVAGASAETGDITDEAYVATLIADADVAVIAVHGTTLLPIIGGILTIAGSTGVRLAVVGGAGSFLVAEGGPRLVDTPEFPAEYKPEALAHAEVLERIRKGAPNLEWFYLSPAAIYGSFAPGETTGAYRTSDEIGLRAADGGPSEISGTDFATAFVDEIENPKHDRARFQVAH